MPNVLVTFYCQKVSGSAIIYLEIVSLRIEIKFYCKRGLNPFKLAVSVNIKQIIN